MLWVMFAIGAALCWGVYGVILHKGQVALFPARESSTAITRLHRGHLRFMAGFSRHAAIFPVAFPLSIRHPTGLGQVFRFG